MSNTDEIKRDIDHAANWVWKEAEDLLGQYETHVEYRRQVDLRVYQAAKVWNVTAESVNHELVRRQAEHMVGSLPRKVSKRC